VSGAVAEIMRAEFEAREFGVVGLVFRDEAKALERRLLEAREIQALTATTWVQLRTHLSRSQPVHANLRPVTKRDPDRTGPAGKKRWLSPRGKRTVLEGWRLAKAGRPGRLISSAA
jgi:hypothetical protein